MLFLCGSVSQLGKFSYSQKVKWTFCVIIVPRSENSNFVPIKIANWKSRDIDTWWNIQKDSTKNKYFIYSFLSDPFMLRVTKSHGFQMSQISSAFSETIAFRQNLRNSRTNRLRHAEYSPRLDRKGILRRVSGQKGISHEGVSGIRL